MVHFCHLKRHNEIFDDGGNMLWGEEIDTAHKM